MKRFWGVVAGLTFGCLTWGQSQADPKRVDMIWNHAVDRINRQTDLWFDDGDFPRVIGVCRVMYELFPDDFEIATNLGWMLENIHEWDQALAIYIKFRAENPRDPDAAYPEADFYYRKKAYPKVPPILEPSLKMVMKPHANNYRTLAHAYEKLDQLSDSQRVWKMMLVVYPSDAPAKLNLARVEKKLKGA